MWWSIFVIIFYDLEINGIGKKKRGILEKLLDEDLKDTRLKFRCVIISRFLVFTIFKG